jgi:hypothetical protein
MATSPLNLPIDVPWKVIAASTDLEATQFGAGRLPPPWRSSLAISVYEPSTADLPPALCHDTISYIKLTCSVTGWQATQEDSNLLQQVYPNLPLKDLIREYLACYGVLLNVAVFANRADPEIPLPGAVRIIDVQPKTRDLYQMATETGEILTGSNSDITTDKSFSTTNDSQWGLSLQNQSGFSMGGSPGPNSNQAAGLTHSWGETDKDSSSTQIDASRDRRERQSTTTSISQMYNLLTGYHIGTNRAVFLVLPRPHILQPTDHRTFIQGLRIIEGIQEFMLIVSRPRDKNVIGLCVEAHLETSHLPEEVQVDQMPDDYEEDFEDFIVRRWVEHNQGPGDNVRIDVTHNVLRDGFVVDTRRVRADGKTADDAHSGMVLLENNTQEQYIGPDPMVDIGFIDWFYGGVTSGSAKVTAWLNSGDQAATLRQKYRVLTRAASPRARISKVTANYIMTSRCLAACFRSEADGCITPDFPGEGVCAPGDWVVNEVAVEVPGDVSAQSRLPGMKEFLTRSQFAMATGWRLPGRYIFGAVGFLDTDYLKNRLLGILPNDQLDQQVANMGQIPDYLRQAITDAFPPNCTVRDVLQPSLGDFAQMIGLNISDAVLARRYLLGLVLDAGPGPQPPPPVNV